MNQSKDLWLTFFNDQKASKHIETPTSETLAKSSKAWFSPANYWQVLEITGVDALSFLQGQISCDMEEVRDDGPRLACCVNLQGRVISNFIVSLASNTDEKVGRSPKNQLAFFILCPPSSLEVTKKTLKKYAIFSKVVIEEKTDALLFVARNKTNLYPEDGLTSSDIVRPNSGSTALLFNDISQLTTAPIVLGAWDLSFLLVTYDQAINTWQHLAASYQPYTGEQFEYCLIEQGLVFIQSDTSEQFTPQEINFDLVNGISFTKGCYTGQEVVARLHYRGKTKRHAYIAKIETTHDMKNKFLKVLDPLNTISLSLNEFHIIDFNNKSQGHLLNTLIIDNCVFMLISLSIKSFEAFQLSKNTQDDDTLNQSVLKITVSKKSGNKVFDLKEIQAPAYL